MGLDISHGTWHGAYSAFHRWRVEIAKKAGFPPLELMEGYYYEGEHNDPFQFMNWGNREYQDFEIAGLKRLKEQLPIKWTLFKKHPLYELLTHSDCDGYINYSKCKKIADELERLLPLLDGLEGGGHIGNYSQKTGQFIDGLRLAYSRKEKLKFG